MGPWEPRRPYRELLRVYHFIYNPIAGKGKAPRFRAALEARFKASGVEYVIHETQGRHHAVDLAKRLTEGASVDVPVDIVVMGGDGSLHEALNGMIDPAAVRMGILPCGSGNDFAAAAGIPETPEGALDVLLNSTAKPTDYLVCGGVRGINAIGTGIDVDILRRYNCMKLLKGSAAYLASLIITLFVYAPRRFSEVHDVASVPHRAFIACAGNGTRFGGGIPICPKASIDDGLMDVVIVDDIRKLHIPKAFIKLMQARVLELPTTVFRQQQRLQIAADVPMAIQIDGEIYEDLPFDVRVVPGGLRVYRP